MADISTILVGDLMFSTNMMDADQISSYTTQTFFQLSGGAIYGNLAAGTSNTVNPSGSPRYEKQNVLAVGADNVVGSKCYVIIKIDKTEHSLTLSGDISQFQKVLTNTYAVSLKSNTMTYFQGSDIIDIDRSAGKVFLADTDAIWNNNDGIGANATASKDTLIEWYTSAANGKINYNNAFFCVQDQNFGNMKMNIVGNVAAGWKCKSLGKYAHAEGRSALALANDAHAEGNTCTARGLHSHAEGNETFAFGNGSHSEGCGSYAIGKSSHAEGTGTQTTEENAHAEGNNTIASNQHSHAEGNSTIASGHSSHAEGNATKAIHNQSHAEGMRTTASGEHSHAEGGMYDNALLSAGSLASGEASHAEGRSTKALRSASHAEGDITIASGIASHAEGMYTVADGWYSHAEGNHTSAFGVGSHAGGFRTVARSDNQFAWNGISTEIYDAGLNKNGSFCVNPQGGTNGFYIGTQNLAQIIQASVNNSVKNVLDDYTFSENDQPNSILSAIVTALGGHFA